MGLTHTDRRPLPLKYHSQKKTLITEEKEKPNSIAADFPERAPKPSSQESSLATMGNNNTL